MIYIFYIFYLALSQEDITKKTYLTLSEQVESYISFKESCHVYQFQVPEIKNQTDLVVQLKSQTPNRDPNLYISKNVQIPLSAQDADVVACEALGMDICVINNEKIKENDTLYISVVCKFSCRYILRIELDEEQTLKLESYLTFKLTSEKQSKIIDFLIFELQEEKTEIEIKVELLNQDYLELPFQVFMIKEENGQPSNNKYDYKAIDTWNNQKVIEFTQTKPYESYKILIQGEQGAVFRVISSRSEKLKRMYLYENIVQVVEKGDFDFYQVQLQYENNNLCDLGIRLTPFKGYAKIFVHYNIQPPLLEGYEWKEENKNGEILIISQQELFHNENVIISNLYITVMGEELCTYELSTTCLYDDQIASSIIHQRIVDNSKLTKVIIVDYRNQIQVNLHAYQGIINFLITDCYDDIQCPFSEELFTNQEKYEQISTYTMLYSKKKQEVQYILNCESFCKYYVIAMLNKDSKQVGRFTIQYKTIEKTINLLENQPHKSFVERDSYQNYKFIVSEGDWMRLLQFVVTPVQGDVTMYLSNIYQQPNEQNHEYKSQNNSINFFEGLIVQGTYYLSIYGESYSKYIITVWVIKNFITINYGQFPWHYIQLYQGDSHEHYITDEQFMLFKIDLKGYYHYEQRDSLNVILQKGYGQFQLFGFDHPETDENKAIWQSRQIISLMSHDPKYPEILYLKIRLEQTEANYGTFRIAYYSYNYMIDLFLDEPFFNFLSANNNQNFLFDFRKQERFVITKRAFDFDQSSLKIEIQNQYGLDIRYLKNNSTIVVSQSKLSYCYNEVALCEGFQFTISSKFDTFYSILISQFEMSRIQLKEDQPITKLLPIGEDYFYLYYQGQEVNILAFTYYGELTLYAKIVQTLDETDPNINSYDKMSKRYKVSYQASIYFSQKELQQYQCVDQCIIKITVIFNSEQQIDESNNYYDYTIQYNSKVITLRESEIQDGLVTQNGYKFYKIHVPKNDTNLMIMLKPNTTCEVDLLVSKSKFPNRDQFDWASFDLYSDVLLIEPGNSIHPNLIGDYYVGVQSYSECYFAIQYNLRNVETYDIFQNLPYKFFVGSDYTIYLRLQTYQEAAQYMIFAQSYSETAYFYVDETDIISSKFDSFSQNLTSFKYNNFGRGYLKHFTTEPTSQDRTLIIALRTYSSEIITLQVNNNQADIFLEPKTLFQSLLQKGNTTTFTLTQKGESTILQIRVFSGLISCTYFFDNFYQNQNFSVLLLLDIRPDNYNNTFNITNEQNSYLKVNCESIDQSYFSIQYFSQAEEMNYIYSIFPSFFIVQAQSEIEIYYFDYEFSPISSIQKTFSILIQIQENYNLIISTQKHRSIPLVKVYSNTTSNYVHPIKETILSNLIQNEYISTDNVYKIVLYNQAQFVQNYQIQVGTSDLKLLIPKIKQLGRNQLHQSSYWVLQQNFGYLFYEIQFCNGIFSVFTSRDLELLKSGYYDNKIDIRQNKQVFGFFERIEYTDLTYLRFDFIKPFDDKVLEALYTIRFYYLGDKNDLPYDQFFPGFQGYLTHNITENDDETINVQIEFAPLQYNKKDQQETFQLQQIEYFVILKEKITEDDLFFDYCTEPFNKISVVQKQMDNEQLLQIKVPLAHFKWQQQQKRYFVYTILATVDMYLIKDDQIIQLDYYYETSSIKWSSQKMVGQEKIEFNYQWIGILVVLIILLIFLILFVKKRRSRFIEKYENNEFSNQKNDGIEMHYRGLN